VISSRVQDEVTENSSDTCEEVYMSTKPMLEPEIVDAGQPPAAHLAFSQRVILRRMP